MGGAFNPLSHNLPELPPPGNVVNLFGRGIFLHHTWKNFTKVHSNLLTYTAKIEGYFNQ